jgi:hypothetical protein
MITAQSNVLTKTIKARAQFAVDHNRTATTTMRVNDVMFNFGIELAARVLGSTSRWYVRFGDGNVRYFKA